MIQHKVIVLYIFSYLIFIIYFNKELTYRLHVYKSLYLVVVVQSRT